MTGLVMDTCGFDYEGVTYNTATTGGFVNFEAACGDISGIF